MIEIYCNENGDAVARLSGNAAECLAEITVIARWVCRETSLSSGIPEAEVKQDFVTVFLGQCEVSNDKSNDE